MRDRDDADVILFPWWKDTPPPKAAIIIVKKRRPRPMPEKATVSWIKITTLHPCGHGVYNGGACVAVAKWEEVRATGSDGKPIDVGKPRLRCDSHFPASTAEVEHIKENW